MIGRVRSASSLLLVSSVLLTLSLPSCVTAQDGGAWVLLNAEASQMVKSGTDSLYNMRYSAADSIFTAMIARDPQHPAGYFLLALVDWWRIVPNLDVTSKVDRYSKSFNNRIDKVLDACQERLDRNPHDIVGLFFKGAALGYRARLVTSQGFTGSSLVEWAEAANLACEAYDIILTCQRLAPSNSDVLLGSGLMNYLAAALPEKFPIARSVITCLPPGDKKIGLTMLRLAGQKAVYSRTEARYALVDNLMNIERNYGEALGTAQELFNEYPDNSAFHKAYARCLYQVSNFAAADSVWSEILRRIQARRPGYELTFARQGLYMLGDCRLRSGDFALAVRLFDESVKQARRMDDEESSWTANALLREGNAYDKLGRRDEALRAYREVLALDNYTNTHANAKKYIEKPFQ